MKKLGFGLMRLPVKSEKPEDIDQEALNQMVDLCLEASGSDPDRASGSGRRTDCGKLL